MYALAAEIRVCLSYYDLFRFRADVFAALILFLQHLPLAIAIAIATGCGWTRKILPIGCVRKGHSYEAARRRSFPKASGSQRNHDGDKSWLPGFTGVKSTIWKPPLRLRRIEINQCGMPRLEFE